MGGTNSSVMFMHVIDGTFQISINFGVTVETAGEFRGICIVINADGEHVVIIVVDMTETVFPVEWMVLLTIKEKHFIIRIFHRIKFAVVGTGIFYCQ